MRTRILIAATAALVFTAGAAFAQLSGAEIVKAWDKNGDGVVTKEEWVAAGRPAERFDAVDANHDGKLTAEEIDQALARLRAARGGTEPVPAPAPPAEAKPSAPPPAAPAAPAPNPPPPPR